MSEPILIKGVVAFPNPNGNREIRFIDAYYHDLFKIPDHSNIVISYLDGGKRCVPCEYIDDTHVDIDGTAFHICQFAELMFNQAPNDREVLAHILNASSAQMSYVSDKPPGHGLIKVGGAIVPLVNEFPKDTSLYWLMTTKPGEG